MANEVSFSGQFLASKNGATVTASMQKVLTMAGDDLVQATQVIGTSAEVLDFGEIAGAPGYVVVQNLDAANFVELATDAGMANKFAKLLAGEWAGFPPSSATIYAKADTAAVRVLVVASEV
jgi:hypothetical protein